MNKKVLGRGLNTLLPARAHNNAQSPQPQGPPTELPVDQIKPNPFQPRKEFDEQALQELAQSIRTDGVIQPLVLREVPNGFQIIAGERRWRAAQMAGLTKVPVHIHDLPDDQMLEVALVENIQREDLNPIESALAFQRLSEDLGLSHEEIGQRTGKDRATITNAIRLLQLPQEVKDLIAAGKLSAGHGRTLLKLSNPREMCHISHVIVDDGWSVRQIEQYTNARNPGQPKTQKPQKVVDPNVKAAVEELERALGTRVRITERGPGKGRVEIDYHSQEDLDRIYSAIVGES